MYQLHFLQTQWLVAAFLGGTIAALCLALFMMAMGRPRPGPQAQERGRGAAAGRVHRFAVPALLLLVYVLTVAFVVAYTLNAVRHTPNW